MKILFVKVRSDVSPEECDVLTDKIIRRLLSAVETKAELVVFLDHRLEDITVLESDKIEGVKLINLRDDENANKKQKE